VLYVPGHAFYPVSGFHLDDSLSSLETMNVPYNEMRLCYSNLNPVDIYDGISKLAKLIS
jgi:hypothetical protein